MIFQEEFPRNKGKPDELFGGCAAAAVISLFLGSVSFFADAKKEHTQSTASGVLVSSFSLYCCPHITWSHAASSQDDEQ